MPAVLLWIALLSPLPAQNNTGSLGGTAICFETDKPLPNVLIRLDGTNKSTHTDENGTFAFEKLAVGEYTIVCIRSDRFSTISDPVKVYAGKKTDVQLKMLKGDPEKFCYFSIGGITVTAERDLMPESHETVHKISSGEIEHMQATNLGDILELIPGADMRSRPGLSEQTQVALRGASTDSRTSDADRPDLFGTRVIVDDIPLSNNANLNSGSYVGYGSNVKTNAETGVDLRTLPADNIKEVEVVSGVPSVEYGDVTGGIVKVKTRSSAEPFRLKAKNNPDTKEFNFGGGFGLAKHTTFNFNLNDAYSLRDLRLNGDEVNRVSLQGTFVHNLMDNKLQLSEKISFTRLYEDYAIEGDPLARSAYNHDNYWRFGQISEYRFSKRTSLYFRGFLNYTRRKSWRRQTEFIDPTYVTDLMSTGVRVADLRDASYTWVVNTTGREYNTGAKLNLKHRIIRKGMVHNLLLGSEFLYDGNDGEGKQFNPLFPPNGVLGKRPRSFNEVPGFKQLSIYAEDRISGKLLKPYTLTLGVRGEMYNPESLGGSKLIKSKNGTFWNPRMGLQIKLHPNLQIRSSYGIASKAPALYQMYPDPFYYDVVEPGFYIINGDSAARLVSTYTYDISNPDLQGYTQKKFELGVDFKFQNMGISFTGYNQKTQDAPASVSLPFTQYTYTYPNWPSAEGKILSGPDSVKGLVPTNYDRVLNLRWTERQGVEVSLRTRRIKSLNMMFRINGAFAYNRTGRNASLSVSTPRSFTEITAANDTIRHTVFPIYPVVGSYNKKLIMNYSLDYINRDLGIWLTFTMYHRIWEVRKSYDWPEDYKLATGYYENGNYYSISETQAALWGLQSSIDPSSRIEYRTPATFWFNLTVSKNIYEGMEVSLFVNNFLNSRRFYYDQYDNLQSANPEIFYGVEFSMMMEPFVKYLGQRLF